MVQNKNILIESRFHDKPIVTDVFYLKNNVKKPIVIFCHGYKGYKDWGAWNLVAEAFVKSDCFFIKFNFSHNGGTAENPIDFPDLEAFSENSFTTDEVDASPGVFLAIPGDAGYTLAPYCARLVVDQMCGRSPEFPLEFFSPRRFES